MRILLLAAGLVLGSPTSAAREHPAALRIGRAGHAFDHVGGINEQAETAIASGATILYATGLGTLGYQGLPSPAELDEHIQHVNAYNRNARARGAELVLGYVCATSIVGLESFDDQWTEEFQVQFKSPPTDWRQQDRQGRPLASWYGGEYQPACMNHPDWRIYQTFIVRQQLESGHDGIFFDNPTVHPHGCYCEHCMQKFAAHLRQAGVINESQTASSDAESLRTLADAHPQRFLQFRSIVARDFLRYIRTFARAIRPDALITCNNSLNAPDRFYSQCRSHGYNIEELSKVGDFVVVEDMVSQPRAEPDGRTVEYGPVYKCLHAISHGKPIVAVTLANDDYHTPPNLMRLAMAEAAAYQASYLSWPTWPEVQRSQMIAAVRPQADLLRRVEPLLNDVTPRADVLLYLPFRRWLETDQCETAALAAALTNENVQYRVVSHDTLESIGPPSGRSVLLVEPGFKPTTEEAATFTAFKSVGGRILKADASDWMPRLKAAIGAPSMRVEGPSTLRALVVDQPGRTIVHLLNLNIQRLSSFEDKVTPASNVRFTVTTPFESVGTITLQTADEHASKGAIKRVAAQNERGSIVDLTVPRLDISTVVVIEEGAKSVR